MNDQIIVGMTGLQCRNALNNNSNNLFNIKTFINIKEYGAVGDGNTDDSNAIEACLVAAQGRTVYFPTGTYKVTRGISVTIEDAVVIYGENAVIIADGMQTNDTILGITSAVGNADNLLANADSGSLYITPTTPVNFTDGDIIRIEDDNDLSEDYVFNGELLQVCSVTDGVIKLLTPVLGTYTTAANARISKMNNNPVLISGLNVVGYKDVQMIGIATFNRSRVSIYNNIVNKCRAGAIQINNCLDGIAFNNNISDCYVQGLGYGININGSKNVDVFSNSITECRHCIITGGDYPNYIIKIHDNTVSSSPETTGIVGAIGTHAYDFYVTITNNRVFGDGILSATGASLTISGNKIYTTESGQMGIKIYFNTMVKNTIIIENNELKPFNDTVKGNIGIFVLAVAGVTCENIIIRGNVVNGYARDLYFYTADILASVVNNFIVKNNEFQSVDGVNIMAAVNATIVRMIVENNLFNAPIQLLPDTLTSLRFSGNKIAENINVEVVDLHNATEVFMSENIFDSVTNADYLRIVACTTLIFINNIIKNNTGTHAALLDTIVNLINQGNSIVNCSNPISLATITNDNSGTNFTIS